MLRIASPLLLMTLPVSAEKGAVVDLCECQPCTTRHKALQKIQDARQAASREEVDETTPTKSEIGLFHMGGVPSDQEVPRRSPED